MNMKITQAVYFNLCWKHFCQKMFLMYDLIFECIVYYNNTF